MEISEILNIVFGGTSVVAVIAWLYFRKENKALKKNEVKVSDTEAQEKQMNLAESYLEKVLALTEKGNANQDEMIRRLDTLDGRIDNIEAYLNGEFKDWKKTRRKK